MFRTQPHTAAPTSAPSWWTRWWGTLPPSRQDRLVMLAPVLAVVLFLVTIAASMVYLHLEEMERESEAVTRDVQYAQQRLRLRLLERQEQLMYLARGLEQKNAHPQKFSFQAASLISQFPEVLSISWIDAWRTVIASHNAASAPVQIVREPGSVLPLNQTDGTFELARRLRHPIYSSPLGMPQRGATLMLQIPLTKKGRFVGTVMAQYSVEGLLRFGIAPEIMARYAVTLLDEHGQVLAGNSYTPHSARHWLAWSAHAPEHKVAVFPVGNGLVLKAQAYRTSKKLVSNGFFWLVLALSSLTVSMLVVTWRHTRQRVRAQQALMTETNFRRAMENSMLTGMRALDMQGRVTYVNPAFCSMTGWTEDELVGRKATFASWPPRPEHVNGSPQDALGGHAAPSGFEARIERRDGSTFDARVYVSPLIAPQGKQTGWMTSMTDITEPRRIREELHASHERFTTVLQSLDAAVSVMPLGSDEMLFTNHMYVQWFGTQGQGHRQLVALAGNPPTPTPDNDDAVDPLAGMPTNCLTEAGPERAEVFAPELDLWIEVRSRYLTWVDGRLAQLVIASDITPRRQAQEQSQRQAERTQKASHLITMGEMASSVAHELNQPLAAISNYCSGMISRLQDQRITPEELLGALDKTARQAQRAGQIIQRIRAFVKRSEPNPTCSQVSLMLNNAIELADIELRRQQIRLTTYVAARLPPLLVDPILIEQVLINLLKNAGEAIVQAARPMGQRHIEVRVGPKLHEGQEVVEFAIRDSGPGVPPEMLERIYEAFYTTKNEGMGIGLKLCRSIVESHQGRMTVHNIHSGQAVVGCCSSFWIPVLSSPGRGEHTTDNDAHALQ